jgi:16S rRNA (uracil1498-N3)-methyltransferase
MQRYFISKKQIASNRIELIGDDVHHVRNVMRNHPKDQFICCVDGMDYRVEVVEIKADTVECKILDRFPSQGEPALHVTVAQGLPKGDKLEWVLQKGTELGASGFLPFSSTRSVVKIEEKKAEKKQARWAKIAKEAAEQSHRGRIPDVALPMSWQALLAAIPHYDLAVIAYERGGQVLETIEQLYWAESILLIIGPEGGFDEQEVEEATAQGAIPITLGPRILRTETAAISLLTCVMFAHGELGGD